MKKGRLLLWTGLLGVILGGGYAASGYALKPAAELILRKNGFPTANIETASLYPNGILLETINLDAEGFSSIESIQITGSIAGLLFSKSAKAVSIKNVEITGELDEAGHLIIAGWDAKPLSLPQGESESAFKIDNINLEGLTLDFETPEGVIRVEAKATLQEAQDGNRTFQSSIWAQQKQLSLNATANGSINLDQSWSAQVDLQEFRLDMPPVKATRAAGALKLNKSPNSALIYMGRLSAGGVKVNQTAFQDFDINFDSSKPDLAEFKTSPTGFDDIQIKGSIHNSASFDVQGQVEIKHLNDVLKLFNLDEKNYTWLDTQQNAVISFATPISTFSEDLIKFSWQAGSSAFNGKIEGDATYNRSDKKIAGPIKANTLSASELENLFNLEGIKLDQGKLDFSGNFSAALDDNEEPFKIDGELHFNLGNISGTYSDYPFSGLNGAVKLDQLYPARFKGQQQLSVMAIGTGVNLTDGNIRFSGSPGKTLKFDKSEFSLAGGKLIIPAFNYKVAAKDNSLTLELKDVDIAQLAQATETDGFAAAGTLNGTLPLRMSKQGISFENGLITSTNQGYFRYTPENFPPALQGDDARMKTVRSALSDFRYDSIEVRIDGALNGDMKTSLKATGKNPLFENRPINLNINLEGALAPALEQALQPEKIAARIEKSVTGDKE